jgi:hypothetical protein
MEDKRDENRDIEREANESENEGEGSKSADRSYRQKVDDFLDKEDPSKLARQAAEDLERDPETYEEAERQGKARIAEEDEADKDLI